MESITLAWPSPRIPPEQLLGVPASGRMLEETAGGSGPGGSLTTVLIAQFGVDFVERVEIATEEQSWGGPSSIGVVRLHQSLSAWI